jgi:prolyl oligopeptidase PreP (S9A serine peptidase family)
LDFDLGQEPIQLDPEPIGVLIRIETRAGHGAGKPTSKTIEELADRWAFLAQSLGIESHI